MKTFLLQDKRVKQTQMEMEGHIFEKSEKLRQLRNVVQVSLSILLFSCGQQFNVDVSSAS